MSEKTPAEKHFDEVLAAQRAKGREKYGKGLDHTEARDWNRMALEEAVDLGQYLAAENRRLAEENARLKADLEALRNEIVERVQPPLLVATSDGMSVDDILDRAGSAIDATFRIVRRANEALR